MLILGAIFLHQKVSKIGFAHCKRQRLMCPFHKVGGQKFNVWGSDGRRKPLRSTPNRYVTWRPTLVKLSAMAKAMENDCDFKVGEMISCEVQTLGCNWIVSSLKKSWSHTINANYVNTNTDDPGFQLHLWKEAKGFCGDFLRKISISRCKPIHCHDDPDHNFDKVLDIGTAMRSLMFQPYLYRPLMLECLYLRQLNSIVCT